MRIVSGFDRDWRDAAIAVTLVTPLLIGCGELFTGSTEGNRSVIRSERDDEAAAAAPREDARRAQSRPPADARAEDWPQFRGPNRDGISSETGLSRSWPESGPRELWRVPLGEGYSGISASGGRLFTMYGRDRSEWIAAFDAATGEEVWRFQSDDLYYDGQGNGPRSTPVVDGDLTFGLGAQGMLHALRTEDGAPVWSHDLKDDYGSRGPTWGFASVPLIEDDLLLVDVGGRSGSSIVAFDKRAGEEVWRSQSDLPGYAAALGVRVGGMRQAIFFTGRSVVSLAPTTGRLYWRIPWRTSYDANAAAPVFVPPDKIFISSGYDVGAVLLRMNTAEDRVAVSEVWRSRVMKNQFSSSVYYDGYLYGFDDSTLKCIEAETGEMKWRTRGFGHGSLFYADDHLIVLSDRGLLALIEATPSSFIEKARAQVIRGKAWTVPTLAGGRLYVRNEREMLALDMVGG